MAAAVQRCTKFTHHRKLHEVETLNNIISIQSTAWKLWKYEVSSVSSMIKDKISSE